MTNGYICTLDHVDDIFCDIDSNILHAQELVYLIFRTEDADALSTILHEANEKIANKYNELLDKYGYIKTLEGGES